MKQFFTLPTSLPPLLLPPLPPAAAAAAFRTGALSQFPPILLLLLLSAPLAAQGGAGVADAATQAQLGAGVALIGAVVNLCYLLGALCGLIGAVQVYTRILDGQQQGGGAFALIRNWFFACLTLLLVPTLVRGLLGV